MAQLKSTVVQGALTVTGNAVADKLIKIGGTSDQILMADGSTYNKSDLTALINAAVTIKGTLGTGGTITSLPTASVSTLGDGYKVTTAGTYNSVAAKVGDMFICYKNGSNYVWMHIPSGDDIEDTWREIKVNDTQILASGITTNALNLKAGKNMTLTNSSGTVTFDATDTGATSIETTGTGNAVTSGSYNATTRKITLNKENSFLPLSGGTLTGALGFKSNYLIKPVADYRCKTSSLNGAITIALPAGISNTMVSMWIDVYNYATDTSFSVHVGGYTYSNSTWTNSPFAMVYGADHKVRLGHNGTNFVIYIGELNSVWKYPQISVRDVIIGYDPSYSHWYTDWAISFTSNEFKNVTATTTFANKVWTNKNLNPSNYLTKESDTLQTVTTRGATTDKAITTAGLTSSSTIYVTGTTGHRDGIRITPYGELSSIWWNATGTDGYTKGQMWGITAYTPSYTGGDVKKNTFRFRGPESSTAEEATDQMWINTSGLVTSRGGFAKSGSSDNYVLLAGGGTKAVSDFATSSGYLPLTGSSTTTATNNMTGPILFKNSDGIILNSTNLDVKIWSVWGNSGSYAEEFGFHLLYKGTGSGDDNSLHMYAHNQTGTKAEVYEVKQSGSTTWKKPINFTGGISEGGTALSSKYLGISAKAADADKLDGQDSTHYLNYNNLSNKPTIPAAQIQSDWNQTDTSKLDYIKNKPTIPTVNNATLTMAVSGTGLSLSTTKTFTANQATNATITYTIDSSAAGNRAANKVVLAKAAGQIDSDKFTVTSAGATAVTMEYDSSYKALKFVFA